MSDDDQPELVIFPPTSSGKGVGIVIPDLLQSEKAIVVVDKRGDVRRFYQRGDDA